MTTATNRPQAGSDAARAYRRAAPRTATWHTRGALARWMIPPASGWQRKSRGLISSGLFGPLLALMTVLILLGISAFLALTLEDLRRPLYLLQLGLLVIGVALIGFMLLRIQQRLMQPLAHLRNWALRMRGGNLSARIPVPEGGEFSELAKDINDLGEELKKLSRQMDREVRKQTERIETKSRSLEILYDVAASINTSRDLDDLLRRFLVTLSGVTNAKAATVRLLTDDGRMRLVASLGLDEKILKEEELIPVQRCMCGKAVQEGEILSQENVRQCGHFAGRPFFDDESVEMIAVPLQYRGKDLGVYNLFVDQPGLVGREDIKDLLTSIGRHLGMAIEKGRLDEESTRLSILRERTMLSHELHDSLAQTLASLRLQVRMLDETLEHDGTDAAGARGEVLRIKNGLDEAYAELRELLGHFRAPFDERGLVSAIEDAIDRFRKDTGILIFFQNNWKQQRLPSVMEMQVLRIVQESLANIRKHSRAHAVRVLMRTEDDGTNMVLIEDDGVGIKEWALSGKLGEHVGLSIMQERARRLGGELSIESEPGEGTRVVLTFGPDGDGQGDLLQMV